MEAKFDSIRSISQVISTSSNVGFKEKITVYAGGDHNSL